MNYGFGIKASKNLDRAESALLDVISSKSVDYIYSESVERRGEIRNLLYIQTKEELNNEEISSCLGSWIVSNYENQLFSEILDSEFMEFSEPERSEILEIAEDRAIFEDNFYYFNKLVKKITNYFDFENTMSVEGFLRFRADEYRIRIEKLLSDAIDDFVAEREYYEFIELLRDFIEDKPPIIDLIHIRENLTGGFEFYDFCKKSIAVSIDEEDLFNSLFSEEDKIISILITLAPKRIIWHSNTKNSNRNLKQTIKSVFKERFSECLGCELCDEKNHLL